MEKKDDNEDSYSAEDKLIKKLLIDTLIIILGCILLNFENSYYLIPGIVITLTGLISFVLMISFNTSAINKQYNNKNSINKES